MTSLFIQTWWQLIRFELWLFTRNFKGVHRRVKVCPIRSLEVPPTLDEIVSGFQFACLWYPKQVLCLQRSAALTCVLRRHGIQAQMVIGVQKLPFRGHAWVEVENHVVNDKEYVPEIYAILDRC
jgi:hypothetical protein